MSDDGPRAPPWAPSSSSPSRYARARSLDEEIGREAIDVHEWATPHPEERDAREVVRLRLENASRACWRASSLHERGSSAMRHAGGNLTTFASDVDVMLVDWRGEKLDALRRAHDAIRDAKFAQRLDLKLASRVPSVTGVDAETGLAFDFSLGEPETEEERRERRRRVRSGERDRERERERERDRGDDDGALRPGDRSTVDARLIKSLVSDTAIVVQRFIDRHGDVFPVVSSVLKLLCARWGHDRAASGGLGSFKLYCALSDCLDRRADARGRGFEARVGAAVIAALGYFDLIDFNAGAQKRRYPWNARGGPHAWCTVDFSHVTAAASLRREANAARKSLLQKDGTHKGVTWGRFARVFDIDALEVARYQSYTRAVDVAAAARRRRRRRRRRARARTRAAAAWRR